MALYGVKRFGDAGVLVTGVSTASGTTDDLGTWNVGIDIEAVLATAGYTLPADATAVEIRMTSYKVSAARWGGVRTNGETLAESQRDIQALDEKNRIVVPFNGTNKLLDFYAEEIGATGIVFYIEAAYVGYVNVPISTRETIATGLLGIKTLTTCAANATALIRMPSNSTIKWCPTAESTTTANSITGYTFALLDASQQLKTAVSNAPAEVCGYWPSGYVEWATWLSGPVTPTIDSAWHTAPAVFVGKKYAFGVIDKSGTSNRFDFRRLGSTREPLPSISGASYDENFCVGLDDDGLSQYIIETGGNGTIYYQMAFEEYTGSSATIVAPAEIFYGVQFELVVDGFDNPLTSADIVDANGNSITVSINSNLLTIPAPSAGVSNLISGVITITATDGVKTAPDDTVLSPATGNDIVTVSTPIDDGHSIASLLLLEDPAIVVDTGDQIYFPTSYSTTVSDDTRVQSNLLDAYITVYLIVGTDHDGLTGGDVYQIEYYFESAPPPVSGGGENGITSRGPGSVGITSRGMSSRGMSSAIYTGLTALTALSEFTEMSQYAR